MGLWTCGYLGVLSSPGKPFQPFLKVGDSGDEGLRSALGAWLQNPVLVFIMFVTLGKSLNLLKLQFPHL